MWCSGARGQRPLQGAPDILIAKHPAGVLADYMTEQMLGCGLWRTRPSAEAVAAPDIVRCVDGRDRARPAWLRRIVCPVGIAHAADRICRRSRRLLCWIRGVRDSDI